MQKGFESRTFSTEMKSAILVTKHLYSLITNTTSVNRIDLLAVTLAGPTRHKPVLDSLAVQHLENWLYIE